MTAPGKLSVIVACPESRRTIGNCLACLTASCAGLEHEILIVHAGDADLAGYVERLHPGVTIIDAGKGTLVPAMWSAGYFRATGDFVGFTTGHFFVSSDWARNLVDAVAGGAVGAGTSIDLAPRAGMVGRAIFFLRYSAFLAPAPDGNVAEIAGDSAVYSAVALKRHEESFRQGFWEVEFHRKVRAEGGTLVFAAGASASIGRSYRFVTFLEHRWRHGVQFGRYRIRETGESRLRVIFAAPLVPLVLLWRIAGRAAKRGKAGSLLLSLPALVPLLFAWAGGELTGALTLERPRHTDME